MEEKKMDKIRQAFEQLSESIEKAADELEDLAGKKFAELRENPKIGETLRKAETFLKDLEDKADKVRDRYFEGKEEKDPFEGKE